MRKAAVASNAPEAAHRTRHRNDALSTPTPVVDDDSIYAFFPEIGLLAYEFNGKERWLVPLLTIPRRGGGGILAHHLRSQVILQIDTPDPS
jgi:hypothetical protein